MLRRVDLFLLAFFSLAGASHAQSLDPAGLIRPVLLERAVEAMEARGHDGHATGIYTWRYLHRLGSRADALLAEYAAALAARGLRRDA